MELKRGVNVGEIDLILAVDSTVVIVDRVGMHEMTISEREHECE